MSVIRKILCLKHVNKKLTIKPLAAFSKHYSRDASQFILHSDLPDIDIPKVSVDEFVFSKIDNWLDRTATECGITGRKYTFGEVKTKTVNLGRALQKKLKLQQGDVIAILLTNSPEYVIATVGALKAGLIVTTLNPIYTPDEISRQLKDCSAKAIITLPEFFPLVKNSINLAKIPITVLTIKTQPGQAVPEGAFNFDEFTANIDYPDLPPRDPEEIAFLPYSSGTTGLPKGVELTHYNIVTNLTQFNVKEIQVTAETTRDHQDIAPAVLPKFHIYGLTANTLHLLGEGCKTVSIPKFSPEVYINTLRTYKPHVLYVAPPILLFLANHPSVTAKDLESVRTVISGAAPLGGSDEERFLQKAQKNINIVQGYGLTETSPMVLFRRIELRKIPSSSGSIGRPVPLTSVKLVNPDDPDQTPLGPNQLGELLIKGPQVMKGYHKKPEQTREAFTEDGWFNSGDMMYYNEDKLFFITDRLKELIKVKGFQVPPAELEEVIRDFPDVNDVAVIGIPDAASGEVPRAYVVQKPGKSVHAQKLDEFVASKVAPYKRLKGGIAIVESIPKNASGKIMRRVLREEYEKARKN